MLSATNGLRRASLSVEHTTSEDWDLLEKIPSLLREENVLETDESKKIVEWYEPKELQVLLFKNFMYKTETPYLLY